MNVVTLHVLRSFHSADFGEVRIAAPALDPDARVVVFEGLPPDVLPYLAHLAPVALQGDVDGRRVYAEQLPEGVLLDEVDLPTSLAAFVGAGIIEAVLYLHHTGNVHGGIAPDRVAVGIDGEVVVFGRGRVGSTVELDAQACQDLIGGLGLTTDESMSLADLHTQLRQVSDPSDRQALGSLVRGLIGQIAVLDQIHVQIGPTPDSLDEVQPDLGPDTTDSPGLLDRWAVTTHHGHDDSTAELTGAVNSSASPLALTLWTSLAAPSAHPLPDGRFDEVDGQPSRGLRALLVDEAPDSLPGMFSGSVPPFLLDMDDLTSESPPDRDDDTEDMPFPEVTPVDDDGDTAIYDMRERALFEAIQKADDRTTIADLEARVSDAERRAMEAERRARAAEEAARQAPSPPPPVGRLRGFFRIEVFVAVAIVGLMAWLVYMAFG